MPQILQVQQKLQQLPQQQHNTLDRLHLTIEFCTRHKHCAFLPPAPVFLHFVCTASGGYNNNSNKNTNSPGSSGLLWVYEVFALVGASICGHS